MRIPPRDPSCRAHPAQLFFPGADKKLHGKATLLSVFQKCEDAVITATDDCSEDAAGCRKTLELAKGIVEGMLDHARLEEVGGGEGGGGGGGRRRLFGLCVQKCV